MTDKINYYNRDSKIVIRVAFKPRWFLKFLCSIDFLNTRIIEVRAITKNTIQYKFFLKLFNRSIYLGDYFIMDIVDLESFIALYGNIFCQDAGILWQFLVQYNIDSVRKYWYVNTLIATMTRLLK